MNSITDSDRVEAVRTDLRRLMTELKKTVAENNALIAQAQRLTDDYRQLVAQSGPATEPTLPFA